MQFCKTNIKNKIKSLTISRNHPGPYFWNCHLFLTVPSTPSVLFFSFFFFFGFQHCLVPICNTHSLDSPFVRLLPSIPLYLYILFLELSINLDPFVQMSWCVADIFPSLVYEEYNAFCDPPNQNLSIEMQSKHKSDQKKYVQRAYSPPFEYFILYREFERRPLE